MPQITVVILPHPLKTTMSHSPLKSNSSQGSEMPNTKIASHMTTKTKTRRMFKMTMRITQAVLTTMLSPSPQKKRTFSSEKKLLLKIPTALTIQTWASRCYEIRPFSHKILSFRRNSSKHCNKINSNPVEQIRKKISDSTFRIFSLLKRNKNKMILHLISSSNKCSINSSDLKMKSNNISIDRGRTNNMKK